MFHLSLWPVETVQAETIPGIMLDLLRESEKVTVLAKNATVTNLD